VWALGAEGIVGDRSLVQALQGPSQPSRTRTPAPLLVDRAAATCTLTAQPTGGGLCEARVLGGGAGSRVRNQIKADALGVDRVPTTRQEAGVRADALIAAAATGHVTDLEATARVAADRLPARPDPDRHRGYQALLVAYRALCDQVAPSFERLAGVSGGAAGA
jgi:hypothetical protein